MEQIAALQRANASRVADQLWIGGDLEVTDDELAAIQLDELEAAGITDVAAELAFRLRVADLRSGCAGPTGTTCCPRRQLQFQLQFDRYSEASAQGRSRPWASSAPH